MRGVMLAVAALVAGCTGPAGLHFLDPPTDQKVNVPFTIHVAFVDSGGEVISSDDFIQIFQSNVNQDAGVIFVGDRNQVQAKDGIATFEGLKVLTPAQSFVLEAEWKDVIEPDKPFRVVP